MSSQFSSYSESHANNNKHGFFYWNWGVLNAKITGVYFDGPDDCGCFVTSGEGRYCGNRTT